MWSLEVLVVLNEQVEEKLKQKASEDEAEIEEAK
jgi:hypothetical protein